MQEFKDKRFVIIGASGGIGSALCSELLACGAPLKF